MSEKQEQQTVLETKIKEIDEQIAILNNLKTQCLTKLQSFSESQLTLSARHQSFDDKITLFKSYFRGRDDIYSIDSDGKTRAFRK